jgi:hypothetical protein
MSDAYRDFLVTIVDEEGGPDPALRERLATCLARRLSRLEAHDGVYPAVGEPVDMLDNLEGKFIWEMTDAEVAENPPTRIDYEILAVDPTERPEPDVPVHVTARVPF